MSPEISDFPKPGGCPGVAFSVDERPTFATTLLLSLEALEIGSSKNLWYEELARRIEDLKVGRAVRVPWTWRSVGYR